MNNKGTITDLDKMHGLLTEYYTKRLESGEILSPGELGQINSFLKNNNVLVALEVEDTPMLSLLEDFKTMDLEIHNGEVYQITSTKKQGNSYEED